MRIGDKVVCKKKLQNTSKRRRKWTCFVGKSYEIVNYSKSIASGFEYCTIKIINRAKNEVEAKFSLSKEYKGSLKYFYDYFDDTKLIRKNQKK